MRHGFMAFLLTTFAVSPVAAADVGDWDVNEDGDITEEEYDSTYAESGAFDRWDLDGDGVIVESEFDGLEPGRETFERWDEDNDGLIDTEKLDTAVYGGFDLDEDGTVTRDEWDRNRSAETSQGTRFASLDLDDDGEIVEEEYYGGVYDFYDSNDSGVLEQYEF